MFGNIDFKSVDKLNLASTLTVQKMDSREENQKYGNNFSFIYTFSL